MLLKVNYLVMKYLHFGSVRGDLQEGNVYAKRLRDYASRCQFSHFPSTKSGFLCAVLRVGEGGGVKLSFFV